MRLSDHIPKPLKNTDFSWHKHAACLDSSSDLFFMEIENAATNKQRIKEAKEICEVCPVRNACLQQAIDNGEGFGVWGGMTSRERAKVRRRQRMMLL